MRKLLMLTTIVGFIVTGPTVAQNRSEALSPATKMMAAWATDASVLAGKWTYRSFNNTTQLVADDAAKALALIFGEGVFTFEIPSSTVLLGVFDMGGGYVLDLKGVVRPATKDSPLIVEIVGTGRANTPTEGWQYDYHASPAYHWPNGINQALSLVGSVIRAKPHGRAQAGYVASFIAVKQP